MILQALTEYYEALAKKGDAARPGWGKTKISYALDLDDTGKLLRVVPLLTERAVGKKTVMTPRELELPASVKRTVGIAANFLWDNSAYLLGFDSKGKPERARDCFADAKKLHTSLLSGVDDPYARAVCGFFENWNVATAVDDPLFADCADDLTKGANLTFLFDGQFPGEDDALRGVWQKCYDAEDGETMRCLVSGDEVVPAKTHPAVKNVLGAQASGAALVSFNAPAFCSYDREQNLNAPVGKYTAFAYTTALNLLLADKDHVRHFGDTTLVFWEEEAESAYQDALGGFLDGGDEKVTPEELREAMDKLVKGEHCEWNGRQLDPKKRFFILGISPNAARLSVRFFLQNEFGKFVGNVQKHYDDLRVVPDGRTIWSDIPLWALLRETVNQNARSKDASPQMTGDTLRAVLNGTPYPATLYQQTQLRIRAEHSVSQGRASIIKAFLLRMRNNQKYREALTVELNEDTNYQPYILGRLFSVLEGLQQAANPGINTTIKDKYFTSAGSTPGIVFPTLLNLAEKHLRKLDGGWRVFYAKQITALTNRITETYPAHSNLYDQGVFQLGYYHQTQKRFEKKDKTAAADTIEEEKENG